MKITYIAKKEDNNILLKNILKNKLYISNVLLNKLKMTNSIFVNGTLKHINFIISQNDTITLDFENMNNIIYTDKNNIY